jgi:hypothetical protein
MLKVLMAVTMAVACGILANLVTEPCRRLLQAGRVGLRKFLLFHLLPKMSRAGAKLCEWLSAQQAARALAGTRSALSRLLPLSGCLSGVLLSSEFPGESFVIVPALIGGLMGFFWGIVLRKSWPCFLVSLGLATCYLAYVGAGQELEGHLLSASFLLHVCGGLGAILVRGLVASEKQSA